MKRRLDTRHIATEAFSFGPVKHDQYPVAGAEAHAEVCGAPEDVCDGTTGSNVAGEP